MKFAKCSEALYYDLVKIPHGHIPAPMVNFWSWLPLPIRGERNSRSFFCPNCGTPSFFKVHDSCNWCYVLDNDFYRDTSRRWRREKWRNRWKKLEYILLPLLILTGKAYYLRSVRYHWIDFEKERVKQPEPEYKTQYEQKTL